MRITVDTREDSYEDALGVLRRAYGRHRVVQKKESEGAAGAKAAGMRSASAGGKDASVGRDPARGGSRPAAKRTAATTAAAVGLQVSTSGRKSAAGTKAARGAPAGGRPGAARKRAAAGVAANAAPRGESEAVRAWAQDQGLQVRARGRMPANVIAAYLEAHPS